MNKSAYNAFKRDPLSNNWFFILVCMFGTMVALIIFLGADRFIEVMSEFIGERGVLGKW